MMLEHDARDRPGELNVFQDIVARLGMDFDKVEFDLQQFFRLGEKFGGNGELAKVVDGGGEAQPLDPVSRQTDFAAMLRPGRPRSDDPCRGPWLDGAEMLSLAPMPCANVSRPVADR